MYSEDCSMHTPYVHTQLDNFHTCDHHLHRDTEQPPPGPFLLFPLGPTHPPPPRSPLL